MNTNNYKRSTAYRRWQMRMFLGSALLLIYTFTGWAFCLVASPDYGAVLYILGLILLSMIFSKKVLLYGWRCPHCKEHLPTESGNIKFLSAEFPVQIEECPYCKNSIMKQ